MTIFELATGFLLGAIGGSFLNVIIYRLPRGLNLWNPARSFCPNCKHSLGFKDLIPLVSYIVQGGKCRYCTAKISFQYFLVEILSAGLGVAIAFKYLVLEDDPLKFVFGLLFVLTLLAIVYIDLRYFVIPDILNGFLLIVGLSQGIFLAQDFMKSLVGAWTGLGLLWVIALTGRVLFKKDAMGHGDLKMSRGIGAMLLAYGAILSLTLAVFLGAAIGLVLILRARMKRNVQANNTVSNVEQPGPESIVSLLKSGAGYALGIDLLGLIFPSLAERWFGALEHYQENENEVISGANEDLLESALAAGVIPFGPCLAAGAAVTLFFEQNLMQFLDLYFAGISPFF